MYTSTFRSPSSKHGEGIDWHFNWACQYFTGEILSTDIQGPSNMVLYTFSCNFIFRRAVENKIWFLIDYNTGFSYQHCKKNPISMATTISTFNLISHDKLFFLQLERLQICECGCALQLIWARGLISRLKAIRTFNMSTLILFTSGQEVTNHVRHNFLSQEQ